MSRTMIFATVVSTIVLGQCYASPARAAESKTLPVRDSTAWRTSQADEIYYTALKYLFGHNDTAMGDMADAYYVVMPVGEGLGDPTDAFMARFAKVTPAVKKGSECKTAGAITDRKLNTAGLLFFVESIEWLSDEEAIVEGGYEEDTATAARVTCRLKYNRKHWKVTKSAQRPPRAPAPAK